jgi:predicted permease
MRQRDATNGRNPGGATRTSTWGARLTQDLRSAARSLRRSPGYATTVVTILAIALGATALVWTAYDAVVLRPLPFARPAELMMVYDARDGRPWPTSPANFLDYRAEAKSFQAMSAFNDGSYGISGAEGAAEVVSGAAVTADFFRVLGVEAARGRVLGVADDVAGAATVVLGHGLWTRRFAAREDVVGRTIVVDGTARTIVGVLPPGLGWPIGAELWLPLTFAGQDVASQRGAHYLWGLGRLAAGSSIDTARAELEGIAARLAKEFPGSNDGISAFLRPLPEQLVRRTRPTLLLLVGAVLLALVAACANLASVALARAVQREREIAVRASLGGAPGRLVREQALETILLAVAGAAVGCLVAAALVRTLPAWAGELPRLGEAKLDLGIALLAAVVAGGCGLAIGILPSLHALRRDPADALRGGRSVAGRLGAGRARGALVVATTALAFVLVAGATLTVRSWGRVSSIDPGFEPSGKLTFAVGIPDGRYATAEAVGSLVDRILERMGRLPGVERAAVSFGQAFGDFQYTLSVRSVDGARLSEDEDRNAAVRIVTPGWFEAMGVPLVAGRTFSDRDRHGAPLVVVASRRAVAELLTGDRPAIGRSIELGGDFWTERGRLRGEVVGVVGDVRDQALDEEPKPILYFVFDQQPASFATVTLRAAPARLDALVEPARRALAEIDPDIPLYRANTLERLIANTLAQRTLAARLLSGFGAATSLLAAVGLFGVLAAAVADRRRELAVRGSLGATPRELVAIVTRRAAWLGVAGLALGLLSAIPFARLIRSQLYEIAPGDPTTLLLAALLLAAVVALASWVPARRAARVDPIAALREE